EDIDAADIGQHHVARVVQMHVAGDVRRQAAELEPAFVAGHERPARFRGGDHAREAPPDIPSLLPQKAPTPSRTSSEPPPPANRGEECQAYVLSEAECVLDQAAFFAPA